MGFTTNEEGIWMDIRTIQPYKRIQYVAYNPYNAKDSMKVLIQFDAH